MTAYYNEIDPAAAETLRELIKAGDFPYNMPESARLEFDQLVKQTAALYNVPFGLAFDAVSKALKEFDKARLERALCGTAECEPVGLLGGSVFQITAMKRPNFDHVVTGKSNAQMARDRFDPRPRAKRR